MQSLITDAYKAFMVENHDALAAKSPHHGRERRVNMKLDIDWTELAKALWKAAWPFIAGAAGGLFAQGCTVGGIGPNFFGA